MIEKLERCRVLRGADSSSDQIEDDPVAELLSAVRVEKQILESVATGGTSLSVNREHLIALIPRRSWHMLVAYAIEKGG